MNKGFLLLAVCALSGMPATHAALIVGNGTFETPSVANFQYNPPTGVGQEWAFAHASGIATNGTISMNAGSGSSGQFGFLQGAPGNNGIVSQTINFDAPGSYTLSYLEAGRTSSSGDSYAGSLDYNVTIQDGVNPAILSVSDFTNSNQAFTPDSYAFTVATAGAYTLSFTALGSHDGVRVDNTAGFDNMTIEATPVPEPGGTALFGFACIGIAALRRRRIA